MAVKKRKKVKLKKGGIIFIVLLCIITLSTIIGIKLYKDYLYKQTNEYKLLQRNYTLEDISLIESKNDSNITNYCLENDKNNLVINILNEKYFLNKNFTEYLNYALDEIDYELKDIIALINTHANNKWYQKEFKTDISLNENMIVNKFYALEETYTPKNLVNISLDKSYGNLGDNKLISYANDAFDNLWEKAHEAGFYLMVTSSYRDYKDQKEIYDYRKNSQGERKADETAARPGHSEHQTGLVVDMTSKTEPYVAEFTTSKAYAWLKENAYKYGWIERYPEGKTYITGYSPESWHWRYVGTKAATIIHNENITYDEYYAYYIEK